MVYLLDVNLLLALGDPSHRHFHAAQIWFTRRVHEEEHGWATCPLTENGFIRISSNPNYLGCLGSVTETTAVLERLREAGRHEFWSDDLSFRKASRFTLAHVAGPRQLTDVYLLGLAAVRGERPATLEQSFPTAAVHGGDAALERVARLAVP